MELLNVTHPKDFQSNLDRPEVSLMLGLKVAVFVVNDKGRFPIHVENVILSDNVLTIEL